MALTDKLTAIADAIRLKTGKTDGMTLEQMPEEIASIQGGEVDIPGVIKAGTYVPGDTFTTSGDEWYYIPMRFMHNGNEYSELSIEGLLGGVVTYVSADGERYSVGSRGSFTDKGEITILEDCDTRELSNYPAEYDWFMQHYTIQGGGGENNDIARQLIEGTLTSLYDEEITHIRIRVFGYNTALKEVNLPNAKTIGMAAFASATALETVKLDSIETLIAGAQDQQFYSCTSLKNVSMNSLKVVGAMSFDGCTSLKQVYLPSLTRVGGNGFIRSGLETAHFPVLSSIGTSAFASTKLKTLVLGGDAVVTLDNVSAFTGTPFASGGTGGTVYVKQALIPSYQTATNWSALYEAGTCEFVAIEGSEYE